MPKNKQKKIEDHLKEKATPQKKGLVEENKEEQALQEILKEEEDFQPPPNFWASYLPNLRRRMEEKRRSRLHFVPVLASALSLLVVAFLLFHSQIYPPNLPPSNLKRTYWDRELSGISSTAQLEKLSASLVHTFRLNDLQEDVTELTVRRVNLEGLGEEEGEELLERLASQLGDEANLAADLLYQDMDIDEATEGLSVKELQELENQLKGT
jgi:hypothetical protein